VSFRDLSEFLTTKPVELPVNGKTYRFPGTVSGRTHLLLRAMEARAQAEAAAQRAGKAPAPDTEVLDDLGDVDLRKELMTYEGEDVERAMALDGCTAAQIRHVFVTLNVWHMQGKDAAERAWADPSLLDPQRPEPNRATRRAAVSTTPSRASTSGTRSRKGSGGAKSSSTGTSSKPISTTSTE
jgi:hypothetical protein